MTKGRASNRHPLNDAYAVLGATLRQVREAAGKTTYQVSKRSGGFFQSGHVSNVEGGFTAPSEDFIKAYVSFGGRYDDLMTLLDRAKRPQQPISRESDDFGKLFLDPQTNPNVLRRGYTVDLQEDTAYINGRGVPTKNLYKASVRPTVSGARYFVFRYGHEEDQRRGVAKVRAGSGCSVALFEESDDGTIYVVLEFDNSKHDELERCHLSWVIDIDSTVPTRPYDAVHTKSPMGHIIKRIQFEAPALPEKIWWFRGADPFEARLEPPDERLLELNATDFYFREFLNVENEACGLAWQWPCT